MTKIDTGLVLNELFSQIIMTKSMNFTNFKTFEKWPAYPQLLTGVYPYRVSLSLQTFTHKYVR